MVAPAGFKLLDGFPTLVTFSLDPDVALWIKSIKPSGSDAGGPIDTTTMLQVRHRTYAPKQLVTATAATGKCAYDPLVLNDIYEMIGKNQAITTRFPDGSTWRHYGWLDKFEPDEISEGVMPLANYTIQPSNTDAAGAEQPPLYTPNPTTSTTTTTS